MRNIPVAVQMYTLREESAEDFIGTLKKVADIGFSGVEFAGYGGLAVEDVKAALDHLGLRAVSSHVPIEQLERNLDEVIREQKVLGSQFVVCPYITLEQRTESGYKNLITNLAKANEACQREGITLCYHNHDFELERLEDGRFALDAIFEDTNVSTELDIYWLTKAGQDPVQWLKRYKNKSPLVHLKDMTNDEERFFAELGTGSVNLQDVLEVSEEVGVKWWIVEQDVCRRSPFESIEMSLHYLKSKLPYLN